MQMQKRNTLFLVFNQANPLLQLFVNVGVVICIPIATVLSYPTQLQDGCMDLIVWHSKLLQIRYCIFSLLLQHKLHREPEMNFSDVANKSKG